MSYRAAKGRGVAFARPGTRPPARAPLGGGAAHAAGRGGPSGRGLGVSGAAGGREPCGGGGGAGPGALIGRRRGPRGGGEAARAGGAGGAFHARGREDAAVPGAPHVLDALRAAGRRAAGHGAHLRAALGGLAAALRLPALPLLPGGGRPALLHLSEHGALLLRKLHRRAGEALPAVRGRPPHLPTPLRRGPAGRGRHSQLGTGRSHWVLEDRHARHGTSSSPQEHAITPSSHLAGSFTFLS